MKPAAIGVRVHSGWGAVVSVTGEPGAEQILERRRIEITDGKMAGAVQPYHFAERLEIKHAEQHIARCEAESARLALAGLKELLQNLEERSYRVVGACILLSSGRPLPTLEKILAAHPMIHTAEGEFFRQAFRDGFAKLKIPVAGIRERDLAKEAEAKFGRSAAKLQTRIAQMGRVIGPPWTTDQKGAALGAFIVLAG